MSDTEVYGKVRIVVRVSYSHDIMQGMPSSGARIATYKKGDLLSILKVSIQNGHYYVIDGIAGYEFSIGVLRPMLSKHSLKKLRSAPVQEDWSHK
jgi:hypothetical protein